MRFISWNVNGLRACVNKGFMDTFHTLDADFFCLQETKLQEGQIQMDLPGYHQYWCYAQKKGYSGTAIFTRYEPLSVSYGIGIEELDTEGRVITLEYPEFYLVTCYTPNAQRGLARIDHRLRWEASFREYLRALDEKKPVILCGDLNVAHKEIDLKNPGSNRGNAGFSDQERQAFSDLLDSGFTDTFRHCYPDKTGAYTWWSYMFNARQNNAGWRIDYFLVSDRLKDAIHDATIHPEFMGSDHCPVGLDLDITCNGGIHIPTPDLPEQKDDERAGGDLPTGPVHIGRFFAAGAIIALLLCTSAFLFLRERPKPTNEPIPSAPQVISPDADGYRLIDAVIDRTGTILPVHDTPSVTSSSLRNYFICGDERYEIQGTVPLFKKHPNFYIQVTLNKAHICGDVTCPSLDLKDLTARDLSIDEDRYLSLVEYHENGTLGGFFIFGYDSVPVTVEITATCGDRPQTSETITVIPTDISTLVDDIHIYTNEIKIMTAPILSGGTTTISAGGKKWSVWGPDEYNWIAPTYYRRWTPNFLIEICFPQGAVFTETVRPFVSVLEYVGLEDLNTTLEYYHDDHGRIRGVLIYGYTSADTELTVNAVLNEVAYSTSISIPATFTGMSTQALARTLATCQELKGDHTNETVEALIESSPAFQELLDRSDAFDHILSVNATISYGTNYDRLLALDHFQNRMSDHQKAVFKAQSDRGILYGDPPVLFLPLEMHPEDGSGNRMVLPDIPV